MRSSSRSFEAIFCFRAQLRMVLAGRPVMSAAMSRVTQPFGAGGEDGLCQTKAGSMLCETSGASMSGRTTSLVLRIVPYGRPAVWVARLVAYEVRGTAREASLSHR